MPFGSLLEHGLMRPGQILYFGKRDDLTAIVLANGHIRHKELTGSIHQVGKVISQGPCNGWNQWYFLDETTGERVVIDKLRQEMRNKLRAES